MKSSFEAALVLETNNLHGATEPAETTTRDTRVLEGIEELLVHLREQTYSLAQLKELVVTHEGLDATARSRIERAAGREVVFVELAEGTGYYAAKNRGFEATTADVVAFGDADCWPEDAWLAQLLAPFYRPGVQAVAGRTCYRGDIMGTAKTTIDFMYFESPLGKGCTRNFYANNVAFRRDVFEGSCYLLEQGFYRGNCQVLGLALQQAGVPVVFEPSARTTHRAPDTLKDAVRLRLLRGADTVELSPHLARTYAPKLPWLANAPGLALLVLASRFTYSVRALGKQDMPDASGARYLACAGAIAGITLLDGLGACMKSMGLARLIDDDVETAALAYHANVDSLSAIPLARERSIRTKNAA